MNKPNILYIHSHDTGRYVQPYGYDIPTPNIQSLADQGVLFRQAFCAGPTCSPSRASLVSGQSPHSNGVMGLSHRANFRLHDPGHHIINTLHAHGYTSALAGLQHIDSSAERIGYQFHDTPRGCRARDVTPIAVDWLRQAPDQPFFLSVGFAETHRQAEGFDAPVDPRYARNGRPPGPLPDAAEVRRDMAEFVGSARDLDNAVGTVLQTLDQNGLADNTLVICTTDHGIAFPRMKCNLTDHGMGVMLIMRGPDGFDGGKVCDAMVSQIDIFPTLCEWLGIDTPAWCEGKSMMPLVRGQADQINDEIFSEVTYHAAYEPKRAVRTTGYKYIRRYDDRATPNLPNCDDSPSKDYLLAHGWAERPVPRESFYDLVYDPDEACNRVDDPACAEVLGDMRRRLDAWMQRTNDPLLDGPVPAPSGAQINDPDGRSPNDRVIVVD